LIVDLLFGFIKVLCSGISPLREVVGKHLVSLFINETKIITVVINSSFRINVNFQIVLFCLTLNLETCFV
jgi:hypothetical protein